MSNKRPRRKPDRHVSKARTKRNGRSTPAVATIAARELKILVISDLHIGDAAKPPELQPHSGVWNTNAGFLAHFKTFIREYDIKPDYLVLSGDITNKADPSEVRHAAKLVEWLTSTLGISEKSVIAVPGNHDLHWAVCAIDESSKGFWSQFRFAQFHAQENVLGKLMRRGGQDVLKAPFFRLDDDPHAIFLSINTAAFDFPADKPHRGTIQPDTLSSISSALDGLKDIDAKFKVCVVHHHPISYSELDPLYADFSKLVNADNLTDLLLKRRFDMLVHGHKHVPFFTIHSRDGARMLPILGAGSFSANLFDPLYQGRVCNQMHQIELSGRDDSTKNAFGRVKSWAHVTANGWVRSKKDHHGIFHLSSFGKYLQLGYVESLVNTLVLSEMSRYGAVRLSKLFTMNRELSFVPTNVLSDALESVCASKALRIVGSVDDPSECTIVSQ